MNKKIIYIFTLLCATTFGSTLYASHVQASATVQLYTMSGFVEMLIEKGIITPNNEQKARNTVSLISKIENITTEERGLNADKVEVSVSQYIEQSKRTYQFGENVEGLLLLVKNTSQNPITLEAKRGCQVVYTITDESGAEVFNKSDEAECKTNEKVTYVLGALGTRLFEIEHNVETYPLQKGTYTFTIDYPKYDGGEVEVTIF